MQWLIAWANCSSDDSQIFQFALFTWDCAHNINSNRVLFPSALQLRIADLDIWTPLNRSKFTAKVSTLMTRVPYSKWCSRRCFKWAGNESFLWYIPTIVTLFNALITDSLLYLPYGLNCATLDVEVQPMLSFTLPKLCLKDNQAYFLHFEINEW